MNCVPHAWQYKVIKERLSFVPDTSFPLDLSFSFLCSTFSLRFLQFLSFHGIQGTMLPHSVCVHWSGTCWSGGHASPLRKAGAWRDRSPLIACQNTHRSEKRRLGERGREKGPRVTQREPKGKSGPVNSHIDTTLAHKSSSSN